VLNQAVDPGMLQVLEGEIVPRLEKQIPNQPTPERVQADAKLHRFTVIFDREGYSPQFLRAMKDKLIACLTYHKYPGENWLHQATHLSARFPEPPDWALRNAGGNARHTGRDKG
jgi:hypothetical protein